MSRISGISVAIASLLLLAGARADPEACDQASCPGPLRYYKDLGCKPVFEDGNTCCATKYDCSHVDKLAKDKCYVNGHVYDLGDALKEEDANPCDKACTCRAGYDGIARFTCAIVDCYFGPPPKPNCYQKRKPDRCCAEFICPEEGEERVKCIVDGETYYEGDYFKPKDVDADVNCYCDKGYEGKNVEPFCLKPNRPYCDPAFRNAGDLHSHCAPVYYKNQNPQTDCSVFSRCQNDNTTVIHNHDEIRSDEKHLEENVCRIGDMIMHLGDTLNLEDCVSCICEVGPVPTCRRLDNKECANYNPEAHEYSINESHSHSHEHSDASDDKPE